MGSCTTCTTSVNQEALRKELDRRSAQRTPRDRSGDPRTASASKNNGVVEARKPALVENICGPRLGPFLQKNVFRHSIGIESLYDALHLGEFRRIDDEVQGAQPSLKKAKGYQSSLNDEPLLVGLRVDMNLAQFRAFNRYNQRYRVGKKHVFIGY